MILRESDTLKIIDDLQLENDCLRLENIQLKLQNERKDKIIRQLAEICDRWYAELKRYEGGK